MPFSTRAFTVFISVLSAFLTQICLGNEEDTQIFKGMTAEEPPNLLFSPEDDLSLMGHSFVTYGEMVDTRDSELTSRQRGKCPYPVVCSATTCCPAGTKCCSGMRCCPNDSNCVAGGCCPKRAVTCGKGYCAYPGSICCGDKVCPKGSKCNTTGGSAVCCGPNHVKCPGICCPAGTRCASRRGYCQRRERPTTVSTSTSAPTSQCTSGAIKRGINDHPEIQERQNLRPDCSYECRNGKWMPLITIENIAGKTDQLFVSMCSGILSTGSKRGGNDNFDILKYGGSKGKSSRRKKAKCLRHCAEQKAVFSDSTKLECDEYPPAMSLEGGKGAHRTCIPANQNSGTQSKIFGDFVRKCSPKVGERFVVRMKGGCKLRTRSATTPGKISQGNTEVGVTPVKRESPAIDTFSTSADELNKFSNMSYIYVPIKDLVNGHYKFDVSFADNVESVEIIDEDGMSYFSGKASGNQLVEFDVDDVPPDLPLPAAMIVNADKKVNVSYTATVTPSPTATSTTSTVPSFSPSSVAAKCEKHLHWLMSVLLVGASLCIGL